MATRKQLTPKQEKFCQCIASGKDGKSSYIEAYNCSSDNSAMIESTKLLKREDITAKIKELRQPIENLAQNTAINERKQQIDYIKKRIAICEKMNDENSIIRYIDQLNKIYGVYKAENDTQKEENKLEVLDIEALQKIASNG